MALNALYPTGDYAEDQPLSHTILTTHVIHRGLPIGVVISNIIPLSSRYIFRRATAIPLTTALLKSTSTGVVVTAGLMATMTFGRMYGREEIEWQDRSWRLLRNKGQTELDDFSAAGGAVGAVVGGVTAKSLPVWRGVVGGAGYGMLGGLAAFAIWKMVNKEKKSE